MISTVVLGVFFLQFCTAQDMWNYPPYLGCNPLPHSEIPLLSRDLSLPQPVANIISEIDTAVRAIRTDMSTLGVSVGIVYNQSLVWFVGHGYEFSGSQISPESIFRIGSISKVFVTIATMILRDQGLISLGDEISKYFPNFRLKDPFPSNRGISFKHLATHTAGLPRESPCNLRSCDFETPEILSRLANVQWIVPSDTIPLYSNLGFSLLGNFIAEIANTTFENLILSKIVGPLNLSNTGVNITKAPIGIVAPPYNSDGTLCSTSHCLHDFGWTNPEGGMYSSVRDLGKLISFFFRDNVPKDDFEQILDGATIREMFKTSWLNADELSGFAMPFELTRIGQLFLREKQGDVNGYSTKIIMDPHTKIGAVILTNIVEHVVPYAEAITRILFPKFSNFVADKSYNPIPPPNWKNYIGIFVSNSSGAEISITSNSAFILAKGALNGILNWISDNNFQILPAPNDQTVCLNVQTDGYYNIAEFQTDGNGNVLSLQIPGLDFGNVYFKSKGFSDLTITEYLMQ